MVAPHDAYTVRKIRRFFVTNTTTSASFTAAFNVTVKAMKINLVRPPYLLAIKASASYGKPKQTSRAMKMNITSPYFFCAFVNC
uniref:Uncharacterized protein n=1 Tax=Romanomermis culicivorax TaxID=13658 RepID=A0A915HIJ3_ROMCU